MQNITRQQSYGNDIALKTAGICRKHTPLNEDDITVILNYAKILPSVSMLQGCDMFIDCFTDKKDEAIVVAQNSPWNSLYNRNLIGEIIYREDEPCVFRTYEIGAPSRGVKAIANAVIAENSMRKVLIRQNVSIIRNDSGKNIGVLIMERPFDESGSFSDNRKEIYENILSFDSTERPSQIVEMINDAIIYFDKNQMAVYANDSAKKLYKNLMYKDELIGMHFNNLVFGEYSYDDVISRDRVEQSNVKIGNYFLNIVYTVIYKDGEATGVGILIKDTTEKVQKEQELILKYVAIEEIHHRVKNNLQTIISLIRLQAKRVESPEAKHMCTQIISRIYSISLMHEILARGGIDIIDTKEMLKNIIDNMKNFILPSNFTLEVEIDGDSFYLEPDIATTIAIISNELLHNALKHAFKNRNSGCISIKLLPKGAYSRIVIEDNGTGFENNDINAENLGLKLVKSLVSNKLGGFLKIETGCWGTRLLLFFK